MNRYSIVDDDDDNDDGISSSASSLPSLQLVAKRSINHNDFLYIWINEVLQLCKGKSLEQDDFYALPKKCSCHYNRNLLKKHWNVETTKTTTTSSTTTTIVITKNTLIKSLWIVYGHEYMLYGVYLLLSTIMQFLGPVLLHKLVDTVSQNNPSIFYLSLYAVCLIASKVATAFLITLYSFKIGTISISITSAIKSNIYEKILRLSTNSRREYVAGSLSNLYTVDINRVVNVSTNLHNFWCLPMQIVISMVLLFQVVSYAMFAGLVTIALILLFNKYISSLLKMSNDNLMESKDSRMKVIGEVFRNLLNIKFMASEAKFIEKVTSARSTELTYIRENLYYTAINIWLLWMSPQAVSTATIATFCVLLKSDVTASDIFTAISLFRLLQDPLRSFPSLITQYYQALSSVERLQRFYDMDDKDVYEWIDTNSSKGAIYCRNINSSSIDGVIIYKWTPDECISGSRKHAVNSSSSSSSGTSHSVDVDSDIDCDGGNAKASSRVGKLLNKVKKTISPLAVRHRDYEMVSTHDNSSKNQNDTSASTSAATSITVIDTASTQSYFELHVPASLCINPYHLVVIAGPVGVGKSSFFGALLGEMYRFKGIDSALCYNGSVSYATQQTWIQNMSIKDNILFGLPYNECRYKKVLYACLLDHDLALLPMGDLTQVGDRGLNLSGGQKARIALARAVYYDSDVLLLDDIFAALDSTAAKGVFDRCILGLCRGKTRVIVTHNIDIINHDRVDMIIRIDNGIITTSSNATTGDSSGNDAAVNSSIDAVAVDMTQYNNKNVNGTTDASTASTAAATAVGIAAESNDEERAVGKVDWKVYLFYMNAMGGLLPIAFLCLIQISWQILSISADLFLSTWSQESDAIQQTSVMHNILIFSSFSLGSGLIVLVRTSTISYIGYMAAKKLFQQMLLSLINAPMCWHDRNPSGRILNRLSDDQAKIDVELPIALGSVFATIFDVAGTIITVCITTRYLVIALLPSYFIYKHLTNLYLLASRELKRLQSISQSPILSLMSESIEGVYIIRSFGSSNIVGFANRNESLIDKNSNIAYLSNAASSWFMLRIQLIGALILSVIIVITVYFGSTFLSNGLIAMSITYGLSVSDGLEGLVGIIAWFEQSMICPERIMQYIDIDAEGTSKQKQLYSNDSNDDSHTATADASTIDTTTISTACNDDVFDNVQGNIRYEHVSFKYHPLGEVILNSISFQLSKGEKVGVCGRTGSGKSSMLMALFRIAELHKGTIYIDDIDISTVSLQKLRSSIQIIPQTPVIYKGTIRDNLDPFNEYSDLEITNALDRGYLTKCLRIDNASSTGSSSSSGSSSNYLSYTLDENGNNLSVGQKQLLVLCKCILRGSKILMLDESCANIDYDTDKAIQNVLREEFRDCTVFCIAHRLATVIEYDKIIVMSNGVIGEMGSPKQLLSDPSSMFRQLAVDAGIISAGDKDGDVPL